MIDEKSQRDFFMRELIQGIESKSTSDSGWQEIHPMPLSRKKESLSEKS
jgi:hypothetical protein